MSLKYAAIGAMFEALWLSRMPRAGAGFLPLARRHFHPASRAAGARRPNSRPTPSCRCAPDFLDFVIARVRDLGIEIVTLDEAIDRIAAPSKGKPFVVFTFDDAYKDNLQHALPILRQHQCPFTLYVPTALVDGVGEVWWQAIEDIIAGQ